MGGINNVDLAGLFTLAPNDSDGAMVSMMRIGLIIALAWVAVAVAHKVIRTFRARLTAKMADRESIQRAETVGRAARHAITVIVSLLALLLILSELGISVAPLLGAAGVAGVAIGFGAQSLVKDLFAGLSLLIENQIRQGDVVTLGAHTGAVEEVTLRYVRLRDYDGNVHFVPNGSIDSVISMSRGYAYSVVNVNVSYDTDIERAMSIMADVAEDMLRDPACRDRLDGEYELVGVDQLAASAVVIQIRFRVKPLQQWAVRRAYLKLVKQAFERHHIAVPFPHLTVIRKSAQAPNDKGANMVSHASPFMEDHTAQR